MYLTIKYSTRNLFRVNKGLFFTAPLLIYDKPTIYLSSAKMGRIFLKFSPCAFSYIFCSISSICSRLFVLSLHLKTVSYAPDSLYILRFRCVILYLLSDFFDVHCDCRNITYGIHIPDFSEKLILCIYMIWIRC